MISGSMPPRSRFAHTGGFAVICFLLACILAYDIDVLLQGGRVPVKGALGSTVALLAVGALAVGVQLWFRRRIITEFTYDESALRFRTLGIGEMQVRDVKDIAGLSEWRGRGGILGYRLHFRDGAKAYLQSSVSNSRAALEQILERLRTTSTPAPKYSGN